MKIGIIGTHNVGKTSLAHSLAGSLRERGINTAVSPEHVRECPMPAGTENRNSLESQAWIIGKHFIEEIKLQSKYSVVICDRTVICNYAYFLWALKHLKTESSTKLVKSIEGLVDNWSKTYDYVFRLPIMTKVRIMDDGFRSKTDRWQKEIDVILDRIISKKKIKQHIIPLDVNEKRVEKILNIIGKKLPKK